MDKFSKLKAVALAATLGPWELVYDDWSDGDDALISSESRDGMVAIAKVEGGGEESGYDEPFSSEQQANAAFIAAANPAAVLALLAELEAKDKRIAELEAIATEYAGKFQKAQDAAKHLVIMNDSAQAEIVHLKELLATPVLLPNGIAQKIKVPGYYEAINEMMDCVRTAGFSMKGDE
jgi:hypothetical protein